MDNQSELAQTEVALQASKSKPSLQFDIFDIILVTTGVALRVLNAQYLVLSTQYSVLDTLQHPQPTLI